MMECATTAKPQETDGRRLKITARSGEHRESGRFARADLAAVHMSLGNGLGILKDPVFRIGHLGDINDLARLGAISGLKMGLKPLK